MGPAFAARLAKILPHNAAFFDTVKSSSGNDERHYNDANGDVAGGLLLDGVAPSTPAMDIIIETTSSVAATGLESVSSHRYILSNYSGSSSDNELDEEVCENGNGLEC